MLASIDGRPRGPGAIHSDSAGDDWQVRLRERIAERRGIRRTAPSAASSLSVVVLNWNGAAVIGRCLDRVLAQTHPRLQLIVVDNGSTDSSLPSLRERARRGMLDLVESATNRGVGGGRNLGVERARGDVVAFLDNDAFPDPTWATEIAHAFETDPAVGAVASLVFFDRQRAILNSAGGTLNLRGHGADWCFNTPYERAVLPEEVLYPTGCGMAARRELLAAIGPQDEAIPYYGYDDVEVGIRIRALGRRVVLAPAAWIDHEGGHSARLQPRQALWRERGRIRNALKYLPARQVPAWLLHEAQMLDYLGSRRTAALPLGAWTWNLRHLRSALRLRRPSNGVDTQGLLHRSWRGFPWLLPDNRLFRPDPHRVGSSVALDGVRDGDHLVFGWYEAEREGGVDFRRASGAASVLMRAASSRRLKLDWRNGRSGRQVELGMRRIGDIDPLWRASAVPAESWSTCVRDCALPDGVYELLLETAPIQTSVRPRVFGVAVARVELE